jgi:hypothetical protein
MPALDDTREPTGTVVVLAEQNTISDSCVEHTLDPDTMDSHQGTDVAMAVMEDLDDPGVSEDSSDCVWRGAVQNPRVNVGVKHVRQRRVTLH